MDELILPPALRTLSLVGVIVSNIEQALFNANDLLSLELTLDKGKATTHPLPPGLQECAFHSHPPSDLDDFHHRCQGLLCLKLLNIYYTYALRIGKLKKLKELQLSVTGF